MMSDRCGGVKRRLQAVRREMDRAKIDLMLVADRANSFYLSGFPCSNSLVAITHSTAVFLTDFRYLEKAEKQLAGRFGVRRCAQNLTDDLGEILRQSRPKRIGFEGSVAYSMFLGFQKAAGKRRLVEASGVLRTVRAVKDADEIRFIARNQRIAQAALRETLAHVHQGTTEAELRLCVRQELEKRGADEAFDTIVAAGRASSQPHAVAGSRRVRDGQYLLFDLGARRDHYHSDMTRTYLIGERASAKHREIYRVVLEAQEAALSKIRAGVECRDIDTAAREVIAEAGYGDHFGHGLGHGVGLEIHEAPSLSQRSADVLREGMIVTVEPGIYVPHFGGVRIEDLVLVTKRGVVNLTTMPKRFRQLSLGR